MADYTIQVNAKDNTKGTFNSIQGGLGGLTAGAGKFKAALGAAGAALAAFGVGAKIKGAIDDFDNLAKSARTAGAAASNEAFKGFQVLQTAMGEAGIDAATFERAMLQTTSRLKAGTEGQKSFAAVTDKLGDSILDVNGNLKSGDQLLTTMINALNEGKITTEDFAKVVGGRAGPLIQQQFASLNTSAEALATTLADTEKHANIIPLDAAENAELFNDTIGRLQMAFGKLLTEAITPLLPVLTDFATNLLANMPAIVDKVTGAFQTLQPVFSLIGTVLTDVVFPIMEKVFQVLGFIAEAIAPLVESAIPGLKAAFDGLVAIVESIVGFFQGVADSLQGIYDKAVQLKDGVAGTFDNMAESVKGKTKEMTEGVKGFFSDMYQKVVGGSIVPDMVREIIAEFKHMDTAVTQISHDCTQAVQEDFRSLGQTIQDDFIGTLDSALSDGKLTLSDFEGFFRSTLTNILNDALSGGNQLGNIFGSLFGGGGGGLGGLFGGGGIGGLFSSAISGIGSFFGGFFANGGYLPNNKFGVVGEAGPELVMGPAQITPMSQTGAPGTINFNIQALDAKDATQVILENKNQIIGIIQQAGHRRGKEIF